MSGNCHQWTCRTICFPFGDFTCDQHKRHRLSCVEVGFLSLTIYVKPPSKTPLPIELWERSIHFPPGQFWNLITAVDKTLLDIRQDSKPTSSDNTLPVRVTAGHSQVILAGVSKKVACLSLLRHRQDGTFNLIFPCRRKDDIEWTVRKREERPKRKPRSDRGELGTGGFPNPMTMTIVT